MPRPVWAVFHFNALCVYGEMSFPLLYVRVLDLANSDLHFPCTPCKMISDVGTVTAIIYKVVCRPHPFLSYSYLHLEE